MRIFFILAAILLSAMIFLSACAGSKHQILKGTIYVTGNEPFTSLALQTGPEESFHITASDSLIKILSAMQGYKVEIKCDSIEKSEIRNTANVISVKTISMDED